MAGLSSVRRSELAELFEAASTSNAVPEQAAPYRSRPEGAAALA